MPNIKISDLALAATPLDEPNTFLEVQAIEGGIDVSRKISVTDLTSSFGLDASFVTVGLNAGLPNERVLTAGNDINLTDNGAGNTIVIDVADGGALPVPTISGSTLRGAGGTYVENRLVQTSGGGLIVFGVSELRSVTFVHDDTDGRIQAFGGTANFRFESFTGNIDFEDGATVRIRDTADLAALSLQHTATDALIASDTGTVRIGAEGEVSDFAVFGNDAGSGSPVRRLVLRDFDTNGTMNYGIEFQEADLTPTGFIGYGFGGLTQLFLLNRFLDGQFRMAVTDGGGTARNIMLAIPASNIVNLYDSSQSDPNVQIVVFANGSLLARNEKTGPASTERVMTGADRAALVEEWEFDVSTDTATDPGTNDFRMNNANPSLVTQIAVDDLMLSQIGDFGDYFGPELVAGDRIFIKQKNDGTRWASYILSGPPVDATGFWQIPVTADDQGLIFTGAEECSFEFIQAALFEANVQAGSVEDQTLRWDVANNRYERNSFILHSDTIPPTAGTGMVTINATATVNERQPQLWLPAVNTISVQYTSETATNADGFYLRTVGNVSPGTHTWGVYLTLVDTDLFQIDEDLNVNVLAGAGFFIGEKAAAVTDKAAFGQLWVRSDTPNNLLFTDDAGTDFVIGGALAPAGNVLSTGTPVNNQLAIWTAADTIEGDADVTWDGSTFIIANGILDLTQGLDGIGSRFRHTGTEQMSFSSDGAGDIDIDFTNVTDVNFNGGGVYDFSNDPIRSVGALFITEGAAAGGDIAGQGQFWARSDVPNTAMFTDDAGNDFILSATQVQATTSDQSVTSSTVLVDITGLTGFIIKAGTRYKGKLTVPYDQNVGDIKVSLNYSQTAVDNGHREFRAIDASSVQAAGFNAAFGTDSVVTTMTDGQNAVVVVEFAFDSHATLEGTLDAQFAQNTSSGNATTVQYPAWMEVTECA